MVATRRSSLRPALTSNQREYLLIGELALIPRYPFHDELEERQAWREHREELLNFWHQDPDEWRRAGNREDWGVPAPGGPDSIPAAWWKFEASPEQRAAHEAEEVEP